jgi:hypothetical protein
MRSIYLWTKILTDTYSNQDKNIILMTLLKILYLKFYNQISGKLKKGSKTNTKSKSIKKLNS